MTRRIVLNGLPPGIRGPHMDSSGPCNNPRCRACDPVRDQLQRWARRRLRHQERKGKVRP